MNLVGRMSRETPNLFNVILKGIYFFNLFRAICLISLHFDIGDRFFNLLKPSVKYLYHML
jgi:hypothetical protein